MTGVRPAHQLSELARELVRVKRPNVVLALFHWRYEVVTAVSVPFALTELFRTCGVFWSLLVLAGLFNGVFYSRSARRVVRMRLRSVVVQHRLRTAFGRARVCTPDGRRPAILWTRPRQDEVSVSLFCPAGVGYDRIHQQRELLAAACFATAVHVDRHPRFAHLVTLSVCTTRPRPEAGGVRG
jgi:hypothetical protein